MLRGFRASSARPQLRAYSQVPCGFRTLTRSTPRIFSAPAHIGPVRSVSFASAAKELRELGLAPWLKARIPDGFQNFFPRGGGDQQDKKPPDQDPWSGVVIVLVGLSVAALFLRGAIAPSKEITFQQFKTDYLETGKVEKVIVYNLTTVKPILIPEVAGAVQPDLRFNIGSVEAFERQMEEAQRSLGIASHDFIPIQYTTSGEGLSTLLHLIPELLLIGVAVMLMRNMGGFGGGKKGGGAGRGIFSIGKSPATMIKPGDKSMATFKDVAGLDEAKVEVMEFVKFLRHPERFSRLGAKVPKGALLVGPPGTGKTLLAKAVAGEASVPFFSISGSDFVEMFVGVGPARVRDLFASARKHAPCIVFIDEIDAVGRKRSSGRFSGGHDERESTLNQMLVEMDGFNSASGVVVLAATNRADILDSALLRPGRFDRRINIDKPDINGRRQIFNVHLKRLKLKRPQDEIAQRLAALTPGFAGADIANVCNEAAIIAARQEKEYVDLEDFEKANDRVIGGLEKAVNTMSAKEKRLVAVHEAGHAVVGWFLEHADPILKVTIVPRGNGALGFAQYLPKELSLYQQDQLLDMMCMTLGGRAAEQVFFGKVSTGATDDLKKVTKLAYSQVTVYGMSERLGNVSYQSDEENQFTKPFSDSTALAIDEEVRQMVSAAYERTLKLVEEKRQQIQNLADKLFEVETVNHDVLVAVLGHRPFQSDAYRQYLDNAKGSNKEKEEVSTQDPPQDSPRGADEPVLAPA